MTQIIDKFMTKLRIHLIKQNFYFLKIDFVIKYLYISL